MRHLLLIGIACVASWFTPIALGAGVQKSVQEQNRELLLGKWTDPRRPGNSWEFHKDGSFTADISAGEIRSHTGGTYRVLKDGALEMQVRVGGQVVALPKFRVKVTKEKMIFLHDKGPEESYQRVR